MPTSLLIFVSTFTLLKTAVNLCCQSLLCTSSQNYDLWFLSAALFGGWYLGLVLQTTNFCFCSDWRQDQKVAKVALAATEAARLFGKGYRAKCFDRVWATIPNLSSFQFKRTEIMADQSINAQNASWWLQMNMCPLPFFPERPRLAGDKMVLHAGIVHLTMLTMCVLCTVHMCTPMYNCLHLCATVCACV